MQFVYKRYLASREWAVLKRRVRERSQGWCERCRARPYQETHHLTYERIGRERLEDLQALCRPCHAYESGDPDDPMTWLETGALLDRRLAAFAREKEQLTALLADLTHREVRLVQLEEAAMYWDARAEYHAAEVDDLLAILAQDPEAAMTAISELPPEDQVPFRELGLIS